MIRSRIAQEVFVLGWHVRQYLQGKRPDLDALRAARTVVLAKASCYTGALLAGWYGGHVLALFRLTFADAVLVTDAVGREPVYLILAMTSDRGLRIKPQNLLSGLPIKHLEAAS